MPISLRKTFRVFRTLLLVVLVVMAGGAAAFLATRVSSGASETSPKKDDSELAAKLRRDGAEAIIVPEAMAKNIGLKTETVQLCVKPVAMAPLQGRLALDTNRLARVHSRFAGEVMSLGTIEGRTLRVNDRVKQGDLLAVVWSKDLGEKKSELVDAVSKLKADEITLTRQQDAYADQSVPERAVRDAERNVESDRIAVERAERTLKAWRLTDEEIVAVRSEADRKGAKLDSNAWARVEVRATQGGTILEKNVAVGDIIDTTADLFKVGNLSQLLVLVDVYEEDLPLLQSLPKPIAWTVQLPSRPGLSFPGTLEQINAIIDQNQHTALVTGRVENPNGELKAGQTVTATVAVPPPAGELELPTEAVVENGKESVVFIASGKESGHLTRVPVQVMRRGRDVISIKSGGGVKPGDRVVTLGALLLRDAMDDLPPAAGETVAAK